VGGDEVGTRRSAGVVCLLSCGAVDATNARAALTAAGLAVAEGPTNLSRATEDLDAVIVLIAGEDGAALDRIREASAIVPRVLAIAVERAPAGGASGWDLLGAGAADVLRWGPETPRAVAARLARWSEVDALVASLPVQRRAVGRSQMWRALLREVVEVARFTAASVLFTGETGTGKDVVARLLHDLDARVGKGELVVVDCASVMPSLSGSEFFGHEKGSFTGAVSTRQGAFELAHRGTLFLDEIGELPLTLQAELLRAIQERSFRRVGSHRWQRSDFRLACATNRDLSDEMDRGGFRGDLYYRIAEWSFHLPPLRERPEDIVPLARHFLAEFRSDLDVCEFDPAVEAYLVGRSYPGNVRDLRQLVARVAHRHVGPGPVTLGAVPPEERDAAHAAAGLRFANLFERAATLALAGGATMKQIQHEAAEAAVRVAIAEESGSLQRAAIRLGVTDRALQMRRAARRRAKGDVIALR
jgi:transcriptional regulator with GAF, ATPase, and Fis domain